MGMQEKEREEGYWKTFSETGVFPDLPMEFAGPDKAEYALSVLHAPYNHLTKVLFGEVLARAGKLSDEDADEVADAAEWMPKLIFSKKRNYPLRKEMGEAFKRFRREAVCRVLRDAALIEDGYQKAWDWVKKASAVYRDWPKSDSPVSANGVNAPVEDLIRDLRMIAKSGAWSKILFDDRLREGMLFWLVKIMSKGGANVPGMTFVKFFKFDGLSELPDACFVRQERNPKPEKGLPYYPSVAEEIAKNIYRVFKDAFSKSTGQSAVDKDCLQWALDFMSAVYERFPDDEWGDFRVGKMLIWLGDLAAAKERILPIVLHKQTEFWAWDLMGGLFPEKRKECVARALCCKADEKYTGNLKREAQTLGLTAIGKEELLQLAESAEFLLLEGIVPVEGVLIENYKNKEGKHRVRFKGKEGPDLLPVSPAAIHLPKGLVDGTPVWLYRDVADASHLVAVKVRENAELWDIMPADKVTFYGTSKRGKLLFASKENEYVSDANVFGSVDQVEIGSVFDIRYTIRRKEDVEIRTICHAVKSSERSPLIYSYEGRIRFPDNVGRIAFVNDIYLSPELVEKLMRSRCFDGTPVRGEAVKLPPRSETDKYGNRRLRQRKNAITVEMLKGEALEKYRHEHGSS